MAEALEEANVGLSRTLKDLFAGAVGGVAQVLIGEYSGFFSDCSHAYTSMSPSLLESRMLVLHHARLGIVGHHLSRTIC